ncbi:MAG: hypothetical protein HY053_05900 [Proteobacteria bacterium]|nr:hypothetical protein [Pseudomonadota bacterium]
MDDETLLKTMKNGLMIAGHEMGPVGDHWPALNSISQGLDEEFKRYHCDQAVVGEMEFHLAQAFHELEEIAAVSSAEDQAKIKDILKEMWERYYAVLEPVDPKLEPDPEDLVGEGMQGFPNMKAALETIKRLGGKSWH